MLKVHFRRDHAFDRQGTWFDHLILAAGAALQRPIQGRTCLQSFPITSYKESEHASPKGMLKLEEDLADEQRFLDSCTSYIG
jgi:hypothetical protein